MDHAGTGGAAGSALLRRSAVQFIYGFPGTAAETLTQNYPAQFTLNQ